MQSLLPVGPLEQIVTHEVWGEWRLPTVVAKFMLQGEAMQVFYLFLFYFILLFHFVFFFFFFPSSPPLTLLPFRLKETSWSGTTKDSTTSPF